MKLFLILILTFHLIIVAQPKWKKSESENTIKLELFHSTQVASFQTTESLEVGNWMYEISHRFTTPINDGADALWGFDGPAKIRFAIGYGITNDLMVNLGRSNNTDNYDLQFKQKLFQLNNELVPSVFSIVGGLALNSEVPNNIDRSKIDANNFQYYVQLIYNTILFNKKLGIGISPSYLYNSFIYAVDKQYSFTVGIYAQYFFNRMWSFWIEHNAIISGYQGKIRLDEIEKSYNSLSLGVSLETGGHVFEVMVSNNSRINSSQFLVGADRTTSKNGWKFGFGILRYF